MCPQDNYRTQTLLNAEAVAQSVIQFWAYTSEFGLEMPQFETAIELNLVYPLTTFLGGGR